MAHSSDAYAKMIERSATDSEFRRKLVADPETTLKNAGLSVTAGTTIKVLEDSDTVTHLVLPPVVTDDTLSDAELDAVAGGAKQYQTTTWDCSDYCAVRKG